MPAANTMPFILFIRRLPLFAAVLSLVACGGDVDTDRNHFACDFRGSPHKKTDNPNSYFDRVFYYKELDGGAYAENFAGDAQTAKRRGEVIYRALREFAGEREGFYREEFRVYRFHTDSGVMIRSYVFHVAPADYERNFQSDHPHAVSAYVDIRNQPALFALVDDAPPAGHIKVGWDKSMWQCEAVSAAEYAGQGFLGGAIQVLGD